jgi:hypothetical protein
MLAEMTPMRKVFAGGAAAEPAWVATTPAAAEPVRASRFRRESRERFGMMRLR